MSKMLKILVGVFIIGAVLVSGCLQEITNEPYEEITYDGVIYNYSTPGFEIDQKQASIVWNKTNVYDEAKFVTSEKSYSAIVFVHPYTVGPFDPSTAEYIVAISPNNKTIKETKTAVFRLDYQTLDLKTSAYNFSYPMGEELTLEQSTTIMEKEMRNETYTNNSVDSKKVALFGGNYIYSYPASDFGGTIIVNRYAGRVIFYATTILGGKGRFISHEEKELFENAPIPCIENRVESYNLPAYRGTSVHVTLHMLGRGITKGTEVSLDYKTGMVRTDGSFESEPEGVDLIPEQKRLIFPRTVAANDWDIILKSNFTLNVSKEAAEGDYFITVTTKYRGRDRKQRIIF